MTALDAPPTENPRRALGDRTVTLDDVPEVATPAESPYRDPYPDDVTTGQTPADRPYDPLYDPPTDGGHPEPPATPKPPRRAGRISLDRLHRDMDAQPGDDRP